MPNLSISQLPLADQLNGEELFPLVQGGITKHDTLDNIAAYDRTYGVFQTNQTLTGSANVSQSFIIDTTDEAIGISIVDSKKITVSRTGVYDIQFSAQIKQGSGKALLHIWFKRNGANIPESNTAIHISANDYAVAAWNFVKSLNAGDYIELAWMSNQSTTSFPYEDPGMGMPVIPALIVTATQIR